jgi:hypothetical protein
LAILRHCDDQSDGRLAARQEEDAERLTGSIGGKASITSPSSARLICVGCS